MVVPPRAEERARVLAGPCLDHTLAIVRCGLTRQGIQVGFKRLFELRTWISFMDTQEGSSITVERILDAAEALFAEHGFDATSMRMITGRAEVNLAAVNYHFGNKQTLICRVFHRRLSQLNRDRLDALDALIAQTAPSSLLPEQVLDAFFAPAIRMAMDRSGGALFMRLLARTYTAPIDGDIAQSIAHEYEQVMQRYLNVSSQLLPGLSRTELAWRLHFMAGAVTYAMSGADPLALVRNDPEPEPAVLIARLTRFFLGGLQASADCNLIAGSDAAGCRPI